jgi:hypothetical protein
VVNLIKVLRNRLDEINNCTLELSIGYEDGIVPLRNETVCYPRDVTIKGRPDFTYIENKDNEMSFCISLMPDKIDVFFLQLDSSFLTDGVLELPRELREAIEE